MQGPDSAGTSDASVQGTNDDAAVSKLSCVKAKYFKDDYVQLFVRRPSRRSPVINRGYYARWAAVRKLLDQFLQIEGLPRQVLSLGAGFDTTFFVLEEEGRAPEKYYEVDFIEVTSRKANVIATQDRLKARLGDAPEISRERGQVRSPKYSLLAADLRNLERLEAVLAEAEFDFSLPTLILAECVLIYMDPVASRALVHWTAQKFPTAAFVIYEQIRPFDAFGQQMIRNLEIRGCPLLGIKESPSLEAKKDMFTSAGFQSADAEDMDVIYGTLLNPDDIRRIERLEIFDEFEEWHIMQEHYCVAFGVMDGKGVFASFGFHRPVKST